MTGQLGVFIPRSLASFLEVDAIGEHGQSGWFENELVSAFLNVLWPTESAFFKPFGDDPIASAIEVEDFDESAPLVGEEEGRSADGVDFDGIACQVSQSIKGFTHVAGVKGDIDFEVAVESKHES